MTPEDVLQFWFQGDPHVSRDCWFSKDDAYDNDIRERFAFTVEAARDGALDSWAATPEGTLALVIVLDQFSRNIHRSSYLAFAGDAHARRVARSAIAGGIDTHLTSWQRLFLYMPFQHSENLADQDVCVRLFEGLHGTDAGDTLKYAHRHRDVIRQFGRFPHRNTALSRESTEAELDYLAQPDSGL